MIEVSLRETFSAAPLNLVSGIGDLLLLEQGGNLMLYAATRAGGGVIACDVDNAITLVDQVTFNVTTRLPVNPTLDVVSIYGQPRLVLSGSNQTTLLTYQIEAAGTIGAMVKPSGGPAGVISAQAQLRVGSETYLYASMTGDGSLLAYRMAANGALTLVQDLQILPDLQGVNVSDLIEVRVGNENYIAAAATAGDKIQLLHVGADGTLTLVDSLGAENGLGLNGPSGLKALNVHGSTFLLVPGGGSSSVSVIEARPGGDLLLVDHVVDTLQTRFQGIEVLEAVTFAGRGLILAGGGDGGLTLMEILPDGRLFQHGNVLDTPGTALEAITALVARVTATGLDLFVAGEGTGITRLTVNLTNLATPITGGNGADVLTGGTGADLLCGNGGNDSLAGGTGNDVLYDGQGVDQLSGGAGADLFILSADNETDRITDFQVGIDRLDLSAWAGVRSLAGLTYQATINGAIISHGTERLEIVSSNGMTIQLAALGEAMPFAMYHALSALQIAPNVFMGTSASDFILATEGNDTLIATDGDDSMSGSAGLDLLDLSGLTSSISVSLGASSATHEFGQLTISAIEQIIGTDHDDVVHGAQISERLEGALGRDLLCGFGGNDTLRGDDGDDTLSGGAGADSLVGGGGTDLVFYWDEATALRIDMLNPANSTGSAYGDVYSGIEMVALTNHSDDLLGSNGAETVLGYGGNDLLRGRGGNDELRGDIGDDSLSGGAGSDTMNGGAGFDLVFYWEATAGIGLDMMAPLGSWGEAAGDLLLGIELVGATGFADYVAGDMADNRISGLNGNDILIGRDGNDTLAGGDGNDTLTGGAGSDFLQGDAGIDLTHYWNATSGVRADLASTAGALGEAAGDVFIGVENLAGSGFDDQLLGDAAGNVILGHAGHDLIIGRGGNDTLNGDTGNDSLSGGAGADHLIGGAGLDLAFYWESTSAVFVNLDNGYGNGGDATGDRLNGIEDLAASQFHDNLTGSQSANTLLGYNGNDLMQGLGGNDTLQGGDGADSLSGGAGADMLDGGAGIDLVFYWNALAGVAVDLTTTTGATGDAAGDVITSIENLFGSIFADTLAGNAGDNLISGLAGNDRLDGRGGNDQLLGDTGNDTLLGGAGNDYLLGGSGADVFIFSAGADGVADFDASVDRLLLDPAAWNNDGRTLAQIINAAYLNTATDTTLMVFGNGNQLTLVGCSTVAELWQSVSLLG